MVHSGAVRSASSLRFVLSGGIALVWGCGAGASDEVPDSSLGDGAGQAPSAVDAAAVVEGSGGDSATAPAADANVTHCLLDDKTDPVAFCTQKRALAALHAAAFAPGVGVAASWSSLTGRPDLDDSGAPLHDWRDDLGYASAIALYLSSAAVYGDTDLNQVILSDLIALGPLVQKALSPLPDEYTGETYWRLRTAAGGSRFANDTTTGDALDALADAYGAAIASNHFLPLAPIVPVVGDAGSSDAGSTDGGEDANEAAALDGILGRSQPSAPGAYAYAPADVATAALALIDLAGRHPTDPRSASWLSDATTALDHIYRRARDSATGLYFGALVTSSDPDHDRLDPAVGSSDTLLTAVTATVALALSRAESLGSGAAPGVGAYPFIGRVADALAAVNAAAGGLYDGPPGDAGATSTGFLAGYVPSTGTTLPTKATRDNAFLLAAMHRQRIVAGTPWDTEILALTSTLVLPYPPKSSLYSVAPNQSAYFRTVSRSFDFAPDDLYARSYRSAAVIDFVEGISELWFGRPQ